MPQLSPCATVAEGSVGRTAEQSSSSCTCSIDEQCYNASPPLSAALWRRVEGGLFQRILQHPFLLGILDGTLAEVSFRYYVVQDVLYLREYARALSLVAERAPRGEWEDFFSSCAQDTLHMEQFFHKELTELLDARLAHEAPPDCVPSPTTKLYTNHLLSTIHERPFHEGLACIMPCFIVYHSVGKILKAKGSPNALYQMWIDKYGGPEFEEVVQRLERLVDELGAGLRQEECEGMHEQYALSCRMEYLFWDAAFTQQRWPL